MVRRADCIPSQMPRQTLSVEGTTHGLTHTAVPKRFWSGLTVQDDPEVIGFQKRHVGQSPFLLKTRPQTPLLIKKRLHVSWMKSADEIVFALGQAKEFGPHVLHHINVHCLQIGQWVPQGVLFPETGVAMQYQTRIGQPPGQTERPRPQGPVPQVVAGNFGALGIDDTAISRGQQSKKGRVNPGKPHMNR